MLVLISVTISCTESDNAVDELLQNVDRSGAILRTLSPPGEFMVNSNPDMNTIQFTIEVQEANGDIDPDFKEVRVYVGVYQDQLATDPLLDDEDVATSEHLMLTLPAAEFTTISDNDLPSHEITFGTQDVVDSFSTATFTTPTFIEVRLELEMSDGRVISKDNVAATIATGIYFESPFSYVIIFMNF